MIELARSPFLLLRVCTAIPLLSYETGQPAILIFHRPNEHRRALSLFRSSFVSFFLYVPFIRVLPLSSLPLGINTSMIIIAIATLHIEIFLVNLMFYCAIKSLVRFTTGCVCGEITL